MSLRPRLVRHCRSPMTQLFEQQPSLYSPTPNSEGLQLMHERKSQEDFCAAAAAGLDEPCEPAAGDSSGDDRTFDEAVFDLLRVNAEEIAQQITLLDLSLFQAIQPDELTSCAWSQTKHKNEKAYNIVQSTRRFNHINFWVQREILSQEDVQKRAQYLAQFIKICRKLVDMNNLQSAMSILAALQSAAIHRLDRTWSNLSKHQRATYEKLSELFSEASNRQRLRDHMASIKLPCIPYLGLYLADLTYIDVAHPSTGGIESQARQDKMNNILRVIADYQQSSYPFTRREHVRKYILGQQYIEELQKFVEDGNFKLSKKLEPAAEDGAPSGDASGPALKPDSLSARIGGVTEAMAAPNPSRPFKAPAEALVRLSLGGKTAPGALNMVELRPPRTKAPPKAHRKSKSLDNNDIFGLSEASSALPPGSRLAPGSGRPHLARHPLDDSLLIRQTPPASQLLLPDLPLSAPPGPSPALTVDTRLLRSCGIDGPAACSDLASGPNSPLPTDAGVVAAIADSVDFDKDSGSIGSVEGLVNGRGMPGVMSVSTGSAAANSVSSACLGLDNEEMLRIVVTGPLYAGETMPACLDPLEAVCEGCLKRKTLVKAAKRKSNWKMWRRFWVRLVEYEGLFYLSFYRARNSFSYGTNRDEFRREADSAQCLRKVLVSIEGDDVLGPSSGVSSSPGSASPAVGGSAGPASPRVSPARTASFSSRHRFSIPFSHGRHHLTLKLNDLLRQNAWAFRKVGRSGTSLSDWRSHLTASIRQMEDAIERRDLIQLHDS